MNITDEMLSAFLDNELGEPELNAVRDQLALDPALADRLAELASVDTRLQRHYGAIDEQPMPYSVTRLLDQPAPKARADNVVAFPLWRRLKEHSAKAIAAAVVAGFAMTQWLGSPAVDDPAWSSIAQALEQRPSGRAHAVTSGATLTPRLTFQNQAGDWCRQFRIDQPAKSSEHIACRDGSGSWQAVARIDVEPSPAMDTYQTANGGRALDNRLDRMMVGQPVDPGEERALIDDRWGGAMR